jgi:toxin ParE1/3/4
MKPVVFHREAEAELECSIAWYENHQEGVGVDFKDEVKAAIDRIKSNPSRHPRYKGGDLRRCRVKRFPFTIYFLELDEEIWLAAIAHDKRKPDYWASREPED